MGDRIQTDGSYDADVDEDWRALHPAVRTVWSVQVVLVGLIVVGTAGLVIVAAGAEPVWLATLLPLVAGVAWGATAGVALRYRRWGFRFAAEALELRWGVWFRTVSAVPYHRIQQIDVEQGPIERRLGIVKLALKTASTASDGQVPGIRAEEAEGIRERLVAFAARDDGV